MSGEGGRGRRRRRRRRGRRRRRRRRKKVWPVATAFNIDHSERGCGK